MKMVVANRTVIMAVRPEAKTGDVEEGVESVVHASH
jgi:hypothetical protein